MNMTIFQSEALAPIPGLTPKQVAKQLGVTESTIYSWISRGYMRANKVGRKRFISQRQIADFYLQRQTGEYVDMTYANGPVR
jgi:excisionase family DNA binding protein